MHGGEEVYEREEDASGSMEEAEIYAIEVGGAEGEGEGGDGTIAGEFQGAAGEIEGVDVDIRSCR